MYAHALQSVAPLRVRVAGGTSRGSTKAGEAAVAADEESSQLDSIGESLPPESETLLAQPFAVLGRAHQCDLQLADPTVSLRHLLLHTFRDRVFAVDLFSANGSRRDGHRFRSGWIGDAPVQSGQFSISADARIEGTAPAVDVPVSPLDFKPREAESEFYGPLPDVRLQIVQHHGRDVDPAAWPINRVMTLVGRSEKCRITCSHASVSGVHCALVLTPAGLWAIDLVSRTGLKINGEAVRCGLLSEGHELEIGQYRLRAIYDRRPEPATQPVAAAPASPADGVQAPSVSFATKNHRVFRTDPQSPTLVVRPQGDLQDFRYQEVQLEANAIIAALKRTEYPHAVIDFSQVRLVGSVMLESIAGICRAAKGRAAFCCAGPEMYQALVDTNLQTLWYHYNSCDDALAAVTYTD